jgi:hypothetical protein
MPKLCAAKETSAAAELPVLLEAAGAAVGLVKTGVMKAAAACLGTKQTPTLQAAQRQQQDRTLQMYRS